MLIRKTRSSWPNIEEQFICLVKCEVTPKIRSMGFQQDAISGILPTPALVGLYKPSGLFSLHLKFLEKKAIVCCLLITKNL